MALMAAGRGVSIVDIYALGAIAAAPVSRDLDSVRCVAAQRRVTVLIVSRPICTP